MVESVSSEPPLRTPLPLFTSPNRVCEVRRLPQHLPPSEMPHLAEDVGFFEAMLPGSPRGNLDPTHSVPYQVA